MFKKLCPISIASFVVISKAIAAFILMILLFTVLKPLYVMLGKM
jgi:hypothetical protein